jgi:hypothetical protein
MQLLHNGTPRHRTKPTPPRLRHYRPALALKWTPELGPWIAEIKV